MNWLAHVFLSEERVDFQIGNFLADPMKGKLWESASDDMVKGVKVHQLIDSYTDSHQVVSQSKTRLRERGLLKSVVIDLTYDYLLTKHWNRFCSISLKEYTDSFYYQAKIRSIELPSPARDLVQNLVHEDRLNKYHQIEELKKAFKRIDNRLSKRVLARENCIEYYKAVEINIDKIEEDFLIFFPELCSVVRDNLNHENIGHWKI